MFWIQLVVMFAVVFVVCMLALGADGGMGRAFPDRADVVMPRDRLMVRHDVDAIRFSTGLRGYRMDEVDDTLDRLSDELEMRDAYIAELRARLAAGRPAEASPADEEAPPTAHQGWTEHGEVPPEAWMPTEPTADNAMPGNATPDNAAPDAEGPDNAAEAAGAAVEEAPAPVEGAAPVEETVAAEAPEEALAAEPEPTVRERDAEDVEERESLPHG